MTVEVGDDRVVVAAGVIEGGGFTIVAVRGGVVVATVAVTVTEVVVKRAVGTAPFVAGVAVEMIGAAITETAVAVRRAVACVKLGGLRIAVFVTSGRGGGGGGEMAVVAVVDGTGTGFTQEAIGTVAGAVTTPVDTGVDVVGVVVVVVGPVGAAASVFTNTLGIVEIELEETGDEGAVETAGVVESIEIGAADLGDLACTGFAFTGVAAGGVEGAPSSTKLVSSSSSSNFNSGLIVFSSFKSLHISFQLLFPRP